MDEVGIILLTLFLFLLILGPLYRPICATYARVKDHRKFNPRTSQFKDARRKLSTVSERTTTGGQEKLDIESNLNQHDSGLECPICIGPLFVSSDHSTTNGDLPTQAASSHAAGEGGEVNVGGSQNAIGKVRTTLAAFKRRISQLWGTESAPDESPEDDILTLKKCQHAFHARCLSSWFLIERYDCPVCRSQYWQTREMRARAASAPPGTSGGPGAGVARPPPARLSGFTIERLSVPIV